MEEIKIEKGTKLSMEIWKLVCDYILPAELPEQKNWRERAYYRITEDIKDTINKYRENQIYD